MVSFAVGYFESVTIFVFSSEILSENTGRGYAMKFEIMYFTQNLLLGYTQVGPLMLDLLPDSVGNSAQAFCLFNRVKSLKWLFGSFLNVWKEFSNVRSGKIWRKYFFQSYQKFHEKIAKGNAICYLFIFASGKAARAFSSRVARGVLTESNFMIKFIFP